MHVLIVLAHPSTDSFSHALAKSVQQGAASSGHSVEVLDLHDEKFDPVMTVRDLEQFDGRAPPDEIIRQQKRVEAADALCLIYPMWWYGMPAIMKGWLDRVWTAGWAYQWKHDPEGSLLKSRPCTVLTPMGASARQVARWGYNKSLESVWRYGVFGYCGFEPIRLELMEDCSMGTSSLHSRYLQTAFEAGRDIMNDPKSMPGINALLKKGLDKSAFTSGERIKE